MIKIFGFLIFLGLFSSLCGNPGITSARFGEKVRFSLSVPVKFEDFQLISTGERRVFSDKFPNGFLYHDFNISTANEEKIVSWSSGTGDIAPTVFEIGGKKYELELRISDKLGKLAENELVIWKK
ncbi:MAG TPA: hypothetical protein VNB22_01170 [Pyrinomonadaceae bacterium]|jgi:hypothetical protein|nr:hypothetical protein [Pyrinomonadaceae bacterium]